MIGETYINSCVENMNNGRCKGFYPSFADSLVCREYQIDIALASERCMLSSNEVIKNE